MNRVMTRGVALAMLLGAGSAGASLEPASTAHKPPSATAEDAAGKFAEAVTDLRRGDYAKAGPELDRLMLAPGFAELSVDARFNTYNLAAAIAAQNRQYARAHQLAVQATGFEQASGAIWLTRLFSAMSIGDFPDAGRSVEAIAGRWPDRLDSVRPGGIAQLHHALRQAHADDVDRAMLDALFDADWQAGSSTFDSLWRDLALMRLEHGEIDQAAKAAHRIGSAETVVSMRVDKRFDPITRADPHAFDVNRVLDAQIRSARARIKAHPEQLEAVHRLQDLLLEKGKDAEVLAVSQDAVAHAEKGDGEQAYVDFADNYNWVLNQRSLALQHEGRWDDAVQEMARAARRPESGGLNVSQSINLAGLYTDLDQPDRAAAAIVEPGAMSPYGRMQLEYTRLQIAIEKNDAHAVAEHMAYLKKHRDDDIATWQRALLRHGDLDAAAGVLIERLKSPEWRNRALVEMQHYLRGQMTPTMKMVDQRWNALTTRPDVLAAVRGVGRIEHFDIVATGY
ncbi:MAG TPA: hypothetical protein VFR91_05260 [Dyella sp.]|nr:hypothetical protein [Dyella sp.]